jgi:hypothetical protein
LFPTRSRLLPQNLANGNLVSIVGYGRNAAPLRNSALVGTAQVGPAAGDITATTYRYPESAMGPNVIQQGGGVHSLLETGNPLASIDTRVNAALAMSSSIITIMRITFQICQPGPPR